VKGTAIFKSIKRQGLFFRTILFSLVLSLCFLLFTAHLVDAGSLTKSILPEEKGYVLIHTRHSGLQVFIDGRVAGLTPLRIQSLGKGKHQIKVNPPDELNWLSNAWVKNVDVTAGDTTDIQVLFQRSYTIHSDPFGAAVFMDNLKIGETPFYLKLFENEWKNITLIKDGYRDTSIAVGLSDQEIFQVELQQRDKKKDELIRIQSMRKARKTRRVIYSGFALALLSGGLALYFRGKANDRFDRYKSTGNPRVFNKSLNDAKKFDKFAAVSFGVFQVSFVFSFVMFLKHNNN